MRDAAFEALTRAYSRQHHAWRLYKRTLRQYAVGSPEALAAWANYLTERDTFNDAKRAWRDASGVAA